MRSVLMLKSCAVMAWGKSQSAPCGATLIFPDDVCAGLVTHGLAKYVTPEDFKQKETATAKTLKENRKSGKSK